MLEVTSISTSSYDPESLAPMLDERVRDGWEIISIVSAGTKVVAYLQRDNAASATDSAAVTQIEPVEVVATVDEPSGWAAAPEDDTSGPDAATTVIATTAAATVASSEPAAEQPTAETPAQASAQQAAAESTVPAGWYADPSGRYELRYWDGNAWTEHVSRAGQQYTDPPVA